VNKSFDRPFDSAASGVYRVRQESDVREALSGNDHYLAVIELGHGKDRMISAIAQGLDFPEWFGGNWDALEDCLTDLEWHRSAARVIIFRAAEVDDDLGILLDVLASAAEYWRDQGRAFFAVFIDPAKKLSLHPLFEDEDG
jgi:hypothetical protein